MNTKTKDPYSPNLWDPKVDVVIRPPLEVPRNYYYLGRPVSRELYTDAPPKEETRLVRKSLYAFGSQEEADSWATREYSVVEILHTARTFCWRVKNVQ